MGNFLSKWYNEGIASTPPPCMYSKTCYNALSQNACCLSIGKWGTEWGDKNRAPIMFVAFWFSFVSLIFLAAAVACVSTSSDSIKNVPFFKGTITVDRANGDTSEFDYYAGLNRIVIEGCDLGAACPPHSTDWDSVNCDAYFSNCDACADALLGSVTMVIMSFITQIPQCTGDLVRSIGKYDLHCQKVMGIVTGVFGLLNTLAALNSFADTCFRSLDSNLPNLSLTKTPGAAFILLLIATILKVVDIWAHVIVPVPKNDYWSPTNDPSADGDQEEASPDCPSAQNSSGGRSDLFQVEMATIAEAMERGVEEGKPEIHEERYPAKLHPGKR